ncbi:MULTISPECIES: DUF559 domain-containing protein [unclassified Adlercreutzia]|uniref:DUF559 domain-containing protein n=1 Tax=unclassified Adlercreutzia TaxID=2636013 RepID=UPI001981A196|nr:MULTISPECIES: DUF559 domain-containing protein [unclassified Adlercreutzia]
MPTRPSNTHQPAICVGFDTALQILRADGMRSLEKASRVRRMPSRPPARSELDALRDDLSLAYPRTALTKPLHVIVGGERRPKPSKDYQPHQCTQKLSGGSLYAFDSSCLVAAPELAFVQMGTVLPFEQLIELGYELCGTYWRNRVDGTCSYQLNPLTKTSRLVSCAQANAALPGARKALRALQYVADNSASPRESKLAILLALPSRCGGYGLSGFKMNHTVQATRKARAIASRNSFRCDLCWPAEKIDVEYQSKEHHEGEDSRISDSRRANALAAMGWLVVGITNDELDSFTATDVIARSLRLKLGKSNRTSINDYTLRKADLRRRLDLPYEGSRRYVATWEETAYGRVIGQGRKTRDATRAKATAPSG